MNATRRTVYSHDRLRRMFAAESVAIVGTSANPAGLGSRTLANLLHAGYGGRIYPVNAKYEMLGDRRCYPSIAALPETPDCVVIAVPREAVEPVVVECAERGVGGIMVYASGYVETAKPGRAEQQERLARIAREAGIPILGPNCIGSLNYTSAFHPSFVVAPNSGPMRAGAIGLISQSGALAFSLAQAVERGICLSHVLTSGNACDVDLADQISYLAGDPACSAIACLFEGMSDPGRLIEAADIANRAGKPIVMYKMATGEQGAAAAISHTGSIAGSEAAYRAAFRRAGIVTVDNFEALIETAAFFAKAPRPSAFGVGVLAASGGACIMAADKAELFGVELPQPGPDTVQVLATVMPEFGTIRNPCDVTAQGFLGEGLHKTVNAMMADERYGALVLPRIQALPDTEPSIRIYSEAARRHGKIACAIWLSEWMEGPGARETESDPHVAMFRSTDRCFAALAAWHERERWQRAQPRSVSRISSPDAVSRVAAMLDAADGRTLTEREAKRVLKEYGIPVVEERLARTVDEALAAAAAIGYPVAMKVESAHILHKTEAGVVRLNLGTETDVKRAYELVMENARKHAPADGISGVLVQPMVPPGAEIMVGARVDRMFGPLIVVGLGGTLVELMKDTVTAIAPVTQAEAREMLDGLRGRALLSGFRGSAPVDLDRLSAVVCRLSELVADQKGRIAELDVNPLICAGDRIVAVDALIAPQA